MMENKRKNAMRQKVLLMLICLLSAGLVTAMPVNAGFTGMETVAQNVSLQIKWIGLIVVGAISVSSLIRRNWVQAVVTIFVGGGICLIIGNIEVLSSLGAWLAKLITGSSF